MAPSETITNTIDMLKPISPVAHQILAIAADPGAGASDLAEVIIFDPSVTANLLRVCNSAYFGLAVRIDSIQHAVSLLGMDRIVEIIIVHLATGCLQQPSGSHGSYAASDWIRSVASAFLAKSIGMEKDSPEIPFLFTAALLKDIGVSIMASCNESGRSKVQKLVVERGYAILDAEREVYSIDHAILGAMITDKWNFSAKMSHLIRYHHAPLQGIHADRDAAAVYLADIICSMIDSRSRWDAPPHHAYDRALGKLGYSGFDVYRLAEKGLNCSAAARIMFEALQ